MHVAAGGEKLKNQIGAAISDALEHDCYLIVRNGKGSLKLAELEFVRLHIHPPPAEAHAFGLQTKSLLDGRIPAQFDFAAGAEDPVPGQPERAPEYACDLPCEPRQSRRPRHRAIGRNFSPRDVPDGSTNPYLRRASRSRTQSKLQLPGGTTRRLLLRCYRPRTP